MPNPVTDQNLLFGVIALHMDAVTSEQFISACTNWAGNKEKALSEHMRSLGYITEVDLDDINRMIERRMAKHNSDVHESLMASITPEILPVIDQISDPEVQESLSGEIATVAPSESGSVGPNLDLVHTIQSESATRDRYTLSRLQGRGGVGQVWVARDQDLGREVALKELRSETGGSNSIKERFLKEARITGQLEHPGIVPVYELSETDREGRPFYTMRYVRGQTLRDAIKEYHKRLKDDEADALDLVQLLGNFVDICHAVAFAHSREVLHRDLKSENVVLGSYGETVVLDWGLAKIVGEDDEQRDDHESISVAGTDVSKTLDGQVLGTPAYMPPEQAEGRLNEIDQRSDVYGLGAILYEMIAGIAPFTGDQTRDVLQAVIHAPPESPSKLNPKAEKPLEAICLKALSKKRQDRYQSATELGEDVQRYLADEPISCFIEPLSKRVSRWARKHKTIVVGGSVLTVAAIVALTVSTILINEQKQKAIHAKNDATAAKQDAETQRDLATTARAASDRLRVIAEEQRDAAEQAKLETDLAKQESDRLRGVAETERDAANQARADADAARVDAEKQRELAQKNFQQAKEAVDLYLLNVSNATELDKPEFRDLRNSLLESARAYYEDFIDQGQDDPAILVDLAKARISLGRIEQSVGSVETAFSFYDKAVKLLQSHVFDNTDIEQQSTLSVALRLRSVAYRVSQQTNKALADAVRALEIAQSLVRITDGLDDETKERAGVLLFDAQDNHQTALVESGFNADQIIDLQSVIIQELRESYASDESNKELAIQLSQALTNMADGIRSTRGKQAAEPLYAESDEIVQKLLAEDPDDPAVIEARVNWLADYFLSTIDGNAATAQTVENIEECMTRIEVLLKHDPERQRFIFWSYFFKLRSIQAAQAEPGISDRAGAMLQELSEIPKGTYTYFHTRSSVLTMLTLQAINSTRQGNREQALGFFREACVRGLQMLQEYPGNLTLLSTYVRSVSNFAISNGIQHPESLQMVQQTIRELEPYLDRGVDAAKIYVSMIPLYTLLNQISIQNNNPLIGMQISKRALQIALKLHERWPENEELVVGTEPLISSYFGLLRTARLNQESETFAREVLVPFVSSTTGQWQNPKTQHLQAACYMNTHIALGAMGHHYEGVVFFLEAVELYDKCLQIQPDNQLALRDYNRAMGALAIMVSEQLWYDLAFQYGDQMLERVDHPQLKPVMGILLTQSYSRVQRYAETYDLIAKLRSNNQLQDANSKIAYVQGLAEIVRSVEMDESLTDEERLTLATKYRLLAIELVGELTQDENAQAADLLNKVANNITVHPFYSHDDFLDAIAGIAPDNHTARKTQLLIRNLLRDGKDEEARQTLDAWKAEAASDAVIKEDLQNLQLARTPKYDEAVENLKPPYTEAQAAARALLNPMFISCALETIRYAIESAKSDTSIDEPTRANLLDKYDNIIPAIISGFAARDGRLKPITAHNLIWLPENRWLRAQPFFENFHQQNYREYLKLCRSPKDYLTKEAVLRRSLLRDVSRSLKSPAVDTYYKYLSKVSQAILDDLKLVASDTENAGVVGQLTEAIVATQEVGLVPEANDLWVKEREAYLQTLQDSNTRLTSELQRLSSDAPQLHKAVEEDLQSLQQLIEASIQ